MAVLINGNGNEAIYAQQDADWFASIMGNQTAITGIGNKFAASLLDANTIGVSDGVIITQEGRRIQLDVNEIDSFDIPAGGQGETNYYIIGYHLVTGDLSEQYCETFVRLMDNDTDTIPEDTFRGGADEVFVSLYRVTQDDLVITDMDLLLPEITNLSQLTDELSANSTQFYFDYKDGKYGYNTDPSRGAGTFSPFSSIKGIIVTSRYETSNGQSYAISEDNSLFDSSTVLNGEISVTMKRSANITIDVGIGGRGGAPSVNIRKNGTTIYNGGSGTSLNVSVHANDILKFSSSSSGGYSYSVNYNIIR